jgi:hypothetical protein
MKYKALFIIANFFAIVNILFLLFSCGTPRPPVKDSLTTPRPPSAELYSVDIAGQECAAAAVAIHEQTARARIQPTVAATAPNLAAIDQQADRVTAAAAKIDAAGDSAAAQLLALKDWQAEVAEREKELNSLYTAAKGDGEKAREELKQLKSSSSLRMLAWGIGAGVLAVAAGAFLLFQGAGKIGGSVAVAGLCLAGSCWAFRSWGDWIALGCLAVAIGGTAVVVYLKRQSLYQVVSGLESAKVNIPVDVLDTIKGYLHAAQSPATETEIAALQKINSATPATIAK